MSNKIKLGELLEVKRGVSLAGEFYSETGEKIRLTLGNFDYPNGGFKNNISKTDIYFTGKVKPEFILKKGDIITPLTEQVSGLLGETARIPEDNLYIQSGDIGLVVPNSELLDNSFAYYLLPSPAVKKQLGAGAQQTKIRHTSPEKIKDCEVWIPEMPCQKFVGALLDSINAKISTNNCINAELESMAKTIYDYWFTQFDFPDENGKPYKASGGKMVWSDELNREIPKGWRVTTIGEITFCLDYQRIPLSSKERTEMQGDVPYYGATGVMDYVNRFIFDGDYVLMAEDGSVMNEKGNPILQRVSGKVWINNHAHVLHPIKGYSCKLLMLMLKDVQVIKIKTGSIQMKINQENMNKIAVPDIPKNLLNSINKLLELIDNQILQKEQENQQLASLRDWLLPMLMNGQVSFTDKKEEKPQIKISGFEQWLENQGYAARGDVNMEILRDIYEAMDNDDK